jgi:pimeloyl-ACP methyl ester carboxylesterase
MPYATNDGVRIRYEVAGSGPPLLLHIGFAGGLEDWADAGYVAPLAARYRVVLLDPRGQGQSDKPHDPAAYAARRRVGEVVAVLDAAGIDRVHYWGYSLGGWVGFALGAFAPDRLASLLVGGQQPFTGNPRPTEGDFFLDGTRDGMAAFVAACEAADPTFFVSPGERARWLAADGEALRAARLNALTEPDLDRDAVARIRVPTLLYAGTADDPEPKARAVRLLPNASFVALDGLDHAAAFGRSTLILPIAQAFLARADASTEHGTTDRR